MQLTQHFHLSEFTDSNYATRHGIKNLPSPNIIGNLKTLAEALERVRSLLGYPISISSGYRNPELNRGIGGAAHSAHLYGYAADFICPAFGTPKEIVKLIKNSGIKYGIKYDQLLEEGGKWIHLSVSPTMRNQTLSVAFKNGKATYKEFV
jgi:zinc D-Ala-D-Ala carboxypeptidase